MHPHSYRWILCCGAIVASRPSSAAPNVVVIIADDLNTPSLEEPDGLRENMRNISRIGVDYTSAYSVYSVCGPSRTSTLTGVHPDRERHYTYNNGPDTYADYEPWTIAQYLRRKHNYYTASIGKVIHESGSPLAQRAFQYIDTVNDPYSCWGQNVARPSVIEIPDGQTTTGASCSGSGKSRDELITDKALEHVHRAVNASRSFAIFTGYAKPHLPFAAYKKYFEFVDENTNASQKLPRTYNMTQSNAPSIAAVNWELSSYTDMMDIGWTGNDLFYALPEEKAWELRRGYWASVRATDHEIGRLWDGMTRANVLDDTLVVMTSDHGFSLGEFNYWCKHRVLRRDAHVPLSIITPRHYLGEEGGSVYDGPVELLDIVPTILSQMNLLTGDWSPCPRPPATVNNHLCYDGKVIYPPPAEKTSARSSYEHGAYMGYTLFTPSGLRFTAWVGFDNSDSTLWEVFAENGEVYAGLELYNHTADVHETVNIASTAPVELKEELWNSLLDAFPQMRKPAIITSLDKTEVLSNKRCCPGNACSMTVTLDDNSERQVLQSVVKTSFSEGKCCATSCTSFAFGLPNTPPLYPNSSAARVIDIHYPTTAAEQEDTLKAAAAASNRLVGTFTPYHMETPLINIKAYRDTFLREFSMIFLENSFKWDNTNPESAQEFTSVEADALLAISDPMEIMGHVLAWHSQVPSWVTEGFQSGSIQSTSLMDLLLERVERLLTLYRGRVLDWHVVNEAIDDSSGNLRQGAVGAAGANAGYATPYWQYVGESGIRALFTKAKQVDPTARLTWNDYALETNGNKRAATIAMIRRLKNADPPTPIEGVGLQGHLYPASGIPSQSYFQNVFKEFTDEGLYLTLTELDCRITDVSYPNNRGHLWGPLDERLFVQAKMYYHVISAFLSNPMADHIVFAGVTDSYSWIDVYTDEKPFGWFNKSDDPLLLDEAYNKKPAYYAVMAALRGQPLAGCSKTVVNATHAASLISTNGAASSDADGPIEIVFAGNASVSTVTVELANITAKHQSYTLLVTLSTSVEASLDVTLETCAADGSECVASQRSTESFASAGTVRTLSVDIASSLERSPRSQRVVFSSHTFAEPTTLTFSNVILKRACSTGVLNVAPASYAGRPPPPPYVSPATSAANLIPASLAVITSCDVIATDGPSTQAAFDEASTSRWFYHTSNTANNRGSIACVPTSRDGYYGVEISAFEGYFNALQFKIAGRRPPALYRIGMTVEAKASTTFRFDLYYNATTVSLGEEGLLKDQVVKLDVLHAVPIAHSIQLLMRVSRATNGASVVIRDVFVEPVIACTVDEELCVSRDLSPDAPSHVCRPSCSDPWYLLIHPPPCAAAVSHFQVQPDMLLGETSPSSTQGGYNGFCCEAPVQIAARDTRNGTVAPINTHMYGCANTLDSAPNGWRHHNIADGIAYFTELFTSFCGACLLTTDSANDYFESDASHFDMIIFWSTTGDFLTEAGLSKFKDFVRGGGNSLFLHAATDAMYEKDGSDADNFYESVVGAGFMGHVLDTQRQHLYRDADSNEYVFSSHLPSNGTSFDDEWHMYYPDTLNSSTMRRIFTWDSCDPFSPSDAHVPDQPCAVHPHTWYQNHHGGISMYTMFTHRSDAFVDTRVTTILQRAVGFVLRGVGDDDLFTCAKVGMQADSAILTTLRGAYSVQSCLRACEARVDCKGINLVLAETTETFTACELLSSHHRIIAQSAPGITYITRPRSCSSICYNVGQRYDPPGIAVLQAESYDDCAVACSHARDCGAITFHEGQQTASTTRVWDEHTSPSCELFKHDATLTSAGSHAVSSCNTPFDVDLLTVLSPGESCARRRCPVPVLENGEIVVHETCSFACSPIKIAATMTLATRLNRSLQMFNDEVCSGCVLWLDEATLNATTTRAALLIDAVVSERPPPSWPSSTIVSATEHADDEFAVLMEALGVATNARDLLPCVQLNMTHDPTATPISTLYTDSHLSCARACQLAPLCNLASYSRITRTCSLLPANTETQRLSPGATSVSPQNCDNLAVTASMMSVPNALTWNYAAHRMQRYQSAYHKPTSVSELQSAVVSAADGTQISVVAGAHAYSGESACAGCTVINVRNFVYAIDVSEERGFDASSRYGRLRIGAGGTQGQLAVESTALGLVIPIGKCTTVGNGAALSGGLGLLSRQHGLIGANIAEVHYVDHLGDVRIANSTLDPDVLLLAQGRAAALAFPGVIYEYVFNAARESTQDPVWWTFRLTFDAMSMTHKGISDALDHWSHWAPDNADQALTIHFFFWPTGYSHDEPGDRLMYLEAGFLGDANALLAEIDAYVTDVTAFSSDILLSDRGYTVPDYDTRFAAHMPYLDVHQFDNYSAYVADIGGSTVANLSTGLHGYDAIGPQGPENTWWKAKSTVFYDFPNRSYYEMVADQVMSFHIVGARMYYEFKPLVVPAAQTVQQPLFEDGKFIMLANVQWATESDAVRLSACYEVQQLDDNCVGHSPHVYAGYLDSEIGFDAYFERAYGAEGVADITAAVEKHDPQARFRRGSKVLPVCPRAFPHHGYCSFDRSRDERGFCIWPQTLDSGATFASCGDASYTTCSANSDVLRRCPSACAAAEVAATYDCAACDSALNVQTIDGAVSYVHPDMTLEHYSPALTATPFESGTTCTPVASATMDWQASVRDATPNGTTYTSMAQSGFTCATVANLYGRQAPCVSKASMATFSVGQLTAANLASGTCFRKVVLMPPPSPAPLPPPPPPPPLTTYFGVTAGGGYDASQNLLVPQACATDLCAVSGDSACPCTDSGNAANTVLTWVTSRYANILTPENACKHKFISDGPYKHRCELVYDFARLNNKKIRFHALIWHDMTSNNNNTPAESMVAHYTRATVNFFEDRYPGVTVAWDVVNEPVCDLNDATCDANKLRTTDSPWYNGDEQYIDAAFHAAAERIDSSLLYLNEYGVGSSGSCEDPTSKVYWYKQLAQRLISRETPLGGVGFQMHEKLTDWEPPASRSDALRANIRCFRALGLKVDITELDVVVDSTTATDAEAKTRSATVYSEILRVALEENVTSFVLWSPTDEHNWLNSRYRQYPSRHGSLVDATRATKPALDAMLAILNTSSDYYVPRVELAPPPSPPPPPPSSPPAPPAVPHGQRADCTALHDGFAAYVSGTTGSAPGTTHTQIRGYTINEDLTWNTVQDYLPSDCEYAFVLFQGSNSFDDSTIVRQLVCRSPSQFATWTSGGLPQLYYVSSGKIYSCFRPGPPSAPPSPPSPVAPLPSSPPPSLDTSVGEWLMSGFTGAGDNSNQTTCTALCAAADRVCGTPITTMTVEIARALIGGAASLSVDFASISTWKTYRPYLQYRVDPIEYKIVGLSDPGASYDCDVTQPPTLTGYGGMYHARLCACYAPSPLPPHAPPAVAPAPAPPPPAPTWTISAFNTLPGSDENRTTCTAVCAGVGLVCTAPPGAVDLTTVADLLGVTSVGAASGSNYESNRPYVQHRPERGTYVVFDSVEGVDHKCGYKQPPVGGGYGGQHHARLCYCSAPSSSPPPTASPPPSRRSLFARRFGLS